jgi:hypothetical protein
MLKFTENSPKRKVEVKTVPIHDHFKGFLSHTRSWSSFHYLWAGLIAGELNRVLPEGFIAESTLYTGTIEVDVRVDEWANQAKSAMVMYQVPAPSAVISTVDFEASEVQVFDLNNAKKTVGVIEIVSPANKDRTPHRDAFLAKCYSFIAYGVSTVIVDIVTTRSFNFHEALMQKFQADDESMRQSKETRIVKQDVSEKQLYCSAYRYSVCESKPVLRASKVQPIVKVWHYPLQVGDVLPDLPLFISSEVAVPVKLEDAYLRTCQELRIG